MSVPASLRLALLGLREWGRLGIDALDPTALPFRPAQVMRPETLNHWLNTWPIEPARGGVNIGRVIPQAVPSVSSNCENLVLSLEREDGPELPASVFVKVPMAPASTRWFMNLIRSWQLECYFFRFIAADIPLRTPVTYAAHWRGSRFFLVQENLREDPQVELFTNLDMMRGPSLHLVRRCLDAFARLHSWRPEAGAEEWELLLPREQHLMLSPTVGPLSRALNRLALKPCMKKHPGVMPEQVVDAYELTLNNWEHLLSHWYSGPFSLLHGDSHLGNFFVSGDAMGMLDWQAVHWGKGVRDVLYFLVNSLPAETLARHERELVEYYVERRAAHGAPLNGENAWDDYRSFAYHSLMTIVVSIGFGALNEEQDPLMGEILRRAVAAMQRLDYPGWLRAFLAT